MKYVLLTILSLMIIQSSAFAAGTIDLKAWESDGNGVGGCDGDRTIVLRFKTKEYPEILRSSPDADHHVEYFVLKKDPANKASYRYIKVTTDDHSKETAVEMTGMQFSIDARRVSPNFATYVLFPEHENDCEMSDASGLSKDEEE